MANTVNVTTANTFEQWRVKTNELGTAIGDLDALTTGDSGAATIVAALNVRDDEVEANTAIIGTEALWDAAGTYDTIREAVNKNHSDIGVIAATAGIDLAGSSLSGYNGSETTLVAILNAQRAVDITQTTNISGNDTDIATINTKLGTISAAAMGTTAATVGPAILELHGELTTATTNIAGLGTTFVAVAGDTMTGTLISASSGLSGSTAGLSAATLLTLGTGSGTAIKVDSNQRIGIGGAVHATHKVDVSGNLNATTLSYGGTDLKSVFHEQGESFQDAVGAMLGGTETGGISVTYDDTNNHIDFAIADDGHSHVVGNIDAIQEYIEDTVGAMVTGNTESGIAVTYDDGDGTLDFNVNDPTITLTGDVTGSATMTNLGSVSIATTRGVGNVITADIADLAITTGKLANLSVTTGKIAADAVTNGKIADNSIDSEHYVDGSIDNDHIADNAINSEHYADGSIDTAHIAADQIVASLIADNAIDSEHYTDGSIDSAHIAASPGFTGTPTAPTAAASTDTTQIATTAFVQNHAPGASQTVLGMAKMWVSGGDLYIATS